MRTADDAGRAGRPARTDPAALRRRATRCEDVLTVVLGLLAAVGLLVAWVAGGSAHQVVAQRSAAETAQRSPVEATVVDRLIPVTEQHAGMQAATVTWTAPDGRERTGGTTLAGLHQPGDRVGVWVDGRGELTLPPSTPEDAVVVAAATGLAAAVGWGLAVLLLGRLGYRWTGARVARAWELGWAAVEPGWSGRRRA